MGRELRWALWGLTLTTLTYTSASERSKRAMTYKVTTILEPPYTMTRVKSPGVTGNDQYQGFIPDLLREVANRANIKYTISVVSDGAYGLKDQSGNWNGMISEVMRGDADFAAAPMTISNERKKVVQFTEPFMNFGTTLLVKKGYSSVGSIEELPEQTEIQYGAIKAGTTEAFFRNSTDPKYRKIWQKMSKNPSSMMTTIADGVRKVRDSEGKYVFIVESSTADYWLGKQPCDLAKVGPLVGQKSHAFAVNKNKQSLKNKLDQAIRDLRAAGRIEELRATWWSDGARCNSGEIRNYSGIGLLIGVLVTVMLH